MINEPSEVFQKVKKAIEDLRPYLHKDGGDMELVEITEENIVRVKLIGACNGCSMSPMTLKAGLEEVLKTTAPQITAVEAVEE